MGFRLFLSFFFFFFRFVGVYGTNGMMRNFDNSNEAVSKSNVVVERDFSTKALTCPFFTKLSEIFKKYI